MSDLPAAADSAGNGCNKPRCADRSVEETDVQKMKVWTWWRDGKGTRDVKVELRWCEGADAAAVTAE